jgi:hypothetical protein
MPGDQYKPVVAAQPSAGVQLARNLRELRTTSATIKSK